MDGLSPGGGRVLPGEMDGRYRGAQIKVSMTGVTNSTPSGVCAGHLKECVRKTGQAAGDGGAWYARRPSRWSSCSVSLVNAMPGNSAGPVLPVFRFFKRTKKPNILDDSYWFLNVSN